MAIAIRSDFLALAAATLADATPQFEANSARPLSRQSVEAIPGSQRVVLSLNPDFIKFFDKTLGAPDDADVRQLMRNEAAQRAARAAIGRVAGSELKRLAVLVRPKDAAGDAEFSSSCVLLSLPAPLFKRIHSYAARRGVSPHEFLAGAIAANLSYGK